MKVKHYNEMMAYLTRPGFNGGGSVSNNTVLPKRKPAAEVKKRKKINYEKIKQYLGKESQDLVERELGFAIGGGVSPNQLKQRFMEIILSIQEAEAEEVPMLVAEAKDLKDKIDELNKVLAPERQIQITAQGLDFDNPLLDAAKIQKTVTGSDIAKSMQPQKTIKDTFDTLTTKNPANVLVPDFPEGDKGTLADPEEKEDVFKREPGKRIATKPNNTFTQAGMRMKRPKSITDMIRDALKKSDEVTSNDGFADGGDVDTPKRGFVDEPGSYAGKEKPFLMQDPKLAEKMRETKRAKFRATPVGERLQWIADNGKNYNKPTDFVKGYEKHFKHKLGSAKDVLFNKEGKIALGSIDGLQNTGKLGSEGGDLFIFKKGFSEQEIFKASIIQNNPKVQKQFKNLFKNIANNVSEYQELGPEGIVTKLKKDGGNLLNDFDFIKSYTSGNKQTYGGVHSGVTRRSLINLGIPNEHIIAFQSVRQPVLSLKNILTNLQTNPKGFGQSYGISPTTAKKLTGQLDNFMKGYGELNSIVKNIDKDLGDKTFNKIFGGVNFEHTLSKQFGRDYKYLPRNYLLKGQFTTKNFNLLKRDVFDLPLIKLMKQYEAKKISAQEVQTFIDDFNAKTNNYADFSFDTKKGKLAYTDNKVKYDLSRYSNPGIAKQELADNIKLTMSDDFQKGFKNTSGINRQLKSFKSKEAKEILKIIGCGTGKSSGGRIGFQDGATCTRKGVDKVNRGLKDGSEMKNFSKLVNATGAKTVQGVLKTLGSLGIAFEAGLIGLESAVRMGMGDTFSESIKYSTDYLVPGDQTLSANMDKISRELDPGLAKIYGNVQNYYNKQQKLKSFENQKAELENLNASEFDYLPDASEFDSAIETAKKDLDSSTVTLEEELFSERALDVASDKSKSKSFISNQRLKATQMGDVGEDISGLNFDLRGIETRPERGTFDNFRETMSMSQEDLLNVYNDAYFSGNYGDPNTEEARKEAQTDYNRAVEYLENVKNAPLSKNAAEFGLEQTYGFNPLIGPRKVNEPMPYKRQSSYIPSPQQAEEQKILMEEMGRLGAAGGGIAKLAGDRSGKPPESGPTPQGLASIIKRGRKY